jgi:hypothetical protein
MADTAAFCVDCLFPRVPTRQYVLSLPYALRFKMAYSPDATSVVLGAFISAINSDLRRRARKRKLRGHLQTGSLTRRAEMPEVPRAHEDPGRDHEAGSDTQDSGQSRNPQ